MPLYIQRPTSPDFVEAEQVTAGGHSHPGQGQRPARPGDWVVTNHQTGRTEVLTGEEFTSRYMLAPVPSFMLTPAPGQVVTQPTPTSVAPPVEPPVPQPDQPPIEEFDPSGPSTPMNESLVGRPAPTTEVRPRIDEPGPIESPTGLVDQPGDADKEFHEANEPE